MKKIRDDQDYWHPVESYVGQHSEAEFSHIICPSRFDTVMKPQLEDQVGEQVIMSDTTDEDRDRSTRESSVAVEWLDPTNIVRSIVLSLMDSADHVAEWLMPRKGDEATPKKD